MAARIAWMFLTPTAHGMCTAVIVSETHEGFTGMNADCADCDFRLVHVPSSMPTAYREIYYLRPTPPRWVGYGRGALYEPKRNGDEELSRPVGRIPQIQRPTYRFWESVLPLMNEHGLGMTESSCGTWLMNVPIGFKDLELLGSYRPPIGKPVEALLDITTLMQLGMERCKSSRCAVTTMGELAEQYGFLPIVGEWSPQTAMGRSYITGGGEAVGVCDREGECWIFHVIGGLEGYAKSAWVAQRLPRGHAAFIANAFIIRSVPEEPSQNFIFSPALREIAQAAGWWEPGTEFDFVKVFAVPEFRTPTPLNPSLRLWRLHNLASGQKRGAPPLPLHFSTWDYPWTARLDIKRKKITHRDVQDWLADLYVGTEFDLTQGILGGPNGSPFWTQGGESMQFGQLARAICSPYTSYTVVNSSPLHSLEYQQNGIDRRRDKKMIDAVSVDEPILWFAPDSACTGVFLPLLPTYETVDPSLTNGLRTKFTRSSAWWAFNVVGNWISVGNFRNASQEDVFPLKRELEDRIDEELHTLLKADVSRQALGQWTIEKQRQAVDRWWQLWEHLIVKYNDGYYNDVSKPHAQGMGQNIGIPSWFAHMIGFNQDIHPIFTKRTTNATEMFELYPEMMPPGYVAPENIMPTIWDGDQWYYEHYVSTWLRPTNNIWVRLEEAAIALGVCLVASIFGFRMGQKLVTY